MGFLNMSEDEFQAWLASLKDIPSLPELKRITDTLAAALHGHRCPGRSASGAPAGTRGAQPRAAYQAAA